MVEMESEGERVRDLLVVEPESLEVFKGEMSQFSSSQLRDGEKKKLRLGELLLFLEGSTCIYPINRELSLYCQLSPF